MVRGAGQVRGGRGHGLLAGVHRLLPGPSLLQDVSHCTRGTRHERSDQKTTLTGTTVGTPPLPPLAPTGGPRALHSHLEGHVLLLQLGIGVLQVAQVVDSLAQHSGLVQLHGDTRGVGQPAPLVPSQNGLRGGHISRVTSSERGIELPQKNETFTIPCNAELQRCS